MQPCFIMVCVLTYLIQRLEVTICLGEVSSAYLAPNHRAETFSRSSLTNTFFCLNFQSWIRYTHQEAWLLNVLGKCTILFGDQKRRSGWQWFWTDPRKQDYLLIKHQHCGLNMMEQRQQKVDRDAKSVLYRKTLNSGHELKCK